LIKLFIINDLQSLINLLFQNQNNEYYNMKIQHLLSSSILLLLFFACKNKPTGQSKDPNPEPVHEYGCEVTKAQLLGVDTLVGVMQGIDAWGADESLDSIANINDQVASELKALLGCAALEQVDLSGTFRNLNFSQTPDGRIRNFNWYANNGGTWQEMHSIYQYFPEPHLAKTTNVEFFAAADSFQQLKAEKPMYLGFGGDRTCSTCLADYADLFSFEADTLKAENVLSIESRMGDLLKFEFDSLTQTLHFAVVVDDMNEEFTESYKKYTFGDLDLKLEEGEETWQPETNAKVVVDSLVFDGTEFVKK